MIEAINLSKSFDELKAVDSVSLQINEKEVFGLIGTNGAGKSTFLRMLCGVLKPDEGQILIDGEEVFENVAAKSKLFYISDEQHFFPNATPVEMARFYANMYPEFNQERFAELMEKFSLDTNRKINTFSKGMKKQLSIILGICANTKYLLCDETFDGLDPVMRQAVKSIFAGEMADRDFTPIIASHNLRELEDICDHVGLLHRGGVLLSKNLEELKLSIHKIQFVLRKPVEKDTSNRNVDKLANDMQNGNEDKQANDMQNGTEDKLANDMTSENENAEFDRIFDGIDVLLMENRGSLTTVTIKGDETEVMKRLSEADAVFAESLPLSLEEIFISETGVVGYDIKKLIY